MIFYFTGTGNSLYVAKKTSEYNYDRMISIAEEMKKEKLEYNLEKDEAIGFVYPVYGWAPPKIVLDFIKRLNIHNYKDNYIFSIATCGDNIGNTMEVLKKALINKGMLLNSGFSISMPNTYIVLFDVDSKELEKEKLLKADKRIEEINKIISKRTKEVFQLEKGPMPAFLSSVVNPLFNTFGMGAKKFYATDACISCGLCEKICPTGNITVDKKPIWGENCIKCLACIHRCPVKAIQYGKSTLKKGRYINPILK